MTHIHNKHADRSSSEPERTMQSCVRLYEHQADFTRGMRAMSRDGWRLHTFHESRSPQALDLINASAAGMIPAPARRQIVAYFSRPAPQASGSLHYRRRLSRALILLAERIDRPDRSCANPA